MNLAHFSFYFTVTRWNIQTCLAPNVNPIYKLADDKENADKIAILGVMENSPCVSRCKYTEWVQKLNKSVLTIKFRSWFRQNLKRFGSRVPAETHLHLQLEFESQVS